MWIDAGRRIVLALALVVLWGAAAQAEPRIAWKVENSFRFFLDPADTEVHRATWMSLTEAERKSPVLAGRAPAGRAPRGRVERDHVRQDLLGSRAQHVRLP